MASAPDVAGYSPVDIVQHEQTAHSISDRAGGWQEGRMALPKRCAIPYSFRWISGTETGRCQDAHRSAKGVWRGTTALFSLYEVAGFSMPDTRGVLPRPWLLTLYLKGSGVAVSTSSSCACNQGKAFTAHSREKSQDIS